MEQLTRRITKAIEDSISLASGCGSTLKTLVPRLHLVKCTLMPTADACTFHGKAKGTGGTEQEEKKKKKKKMQSGTNPFMPNQSVFISGQ